MVNVIVTGASAGVGRAVAQAFAGPGVGLGLIARNVPRLEAAAAEARGKGARCLVLPADVADAQAVDEAAARFEAEVGPIDIWVNAAMATVLAPVAKTTPEEFARVDAVTYLGTVHGTLAALSRMRPRNRGVILQVGSALAYRSIPLQSAYCAAKSAVVGFTDSLRSELLHDRSDIRLTVVHLPAVNTPQFEWARNKMGRRAQPVPPIFDPERVAEQIVAAAHAPRREYWLGFPAAKAILSYQLVPWLGDRMLARMGYSGQMTEEVQEERPGNLFESVDGDWGAAGRFTGEMRRDTPILLSPLHRAAAGAVMAVVALGLAFAAGAWLF